MDNAKEIVKEKYAEIAKKESNCCCSGKNEKIVDYTIFQDDYSKFAGYVADADLGLGCGVPTEHAGIKEGDFALDLGCGAGNDVFIARTQVGKSGKVIGVDMTQEMIDKANRNKERLGLENVEFKLGEIEQLPVEQGVIDVVLSNCVLNLVPDKRAAFSEIYRVLKPGAHFCISDIVLIGFLPEGLRKSAEMYAGCVSGALQKQDYMNIIREAGFKQVEIKNTKTIGLPDELLSKYLSNDEINDFKRNEIGIFSITVVGYKPEK